MLLTKWQELLCELSQSRSYSRSLSNKYAPCALNLLRCANGHLAAHWLQVDLHVDFEAEVSPFLGHLIGECKEVKVEELEGHVQHYASQISLKSGLWPRVPVVSPW